MTDTHEALRRVLADETATADLSPAFADRVGEAAARHGRRRRHTAQVVGVAVVAVLAAGAFVALRATDDGSPTHVVAGPDGAPAQAWVPMPDGPLSPRDSAMAFTVGDEVLIFGGRSEPGCPAGADCVAPPGLPLSDGAAYDQGSRTWRSIADTPEPILAASGAVVGDRLYLWATTPCPANAFCPQPGHDEFLVYDVGEDAWRRLSNPDRFGVDLLLVADRDRIIGYHSESSGAAADLAYDPATDSWSELPRDRLQGFDRVIVPHHGNLYLFAVPDRASGNEPADIRYYRAAVLERDADTWRMLPPSTLPGFAATWAAFGDLVVNPLPPAPAGSGRSFPAGEAFDTVTEQWSVLPDAPAAAGPFYELGIVLGARYAASYGFVLDPLAGTWSDLPVPPDAADQGAAAAWVGDTLVVWGGTRDGVTIDAGATWTVGTSPAPAPGGDAGTADAPLPTPDMVDDLVAGERVVFDEGGSHFCAREPGRDGYVCGDLDSPNPSVSMSWDYRAGQGSIVVVDGRRRLDRLEVVDADGAVRTVGSTDDGLSLAAQATRIPDTVRIVARDGTVLRVLHPAAMESANDAAVAAGSAAA